MNLQHFNIDLIQNFKHLVLFHSKDEHVLAGKHTCGFVIIIIKVEMLAEYSYRMHAKLHTSSLHHFRYVDVHASGFTIISMLKS